MRLVSFDAGGRPSAALLRDGRVYEIAGGQRVEDGTLDAFLATGRLDDLRPTEDEGVPVEEVTLLPPVTRPGKIICMGLNYRSHAEEQGAEPPATPTFFAKFPNALAPPGGTVKLPEWTRSAVELFCIRSPFRVNSISIASCGPASSGVTSAGPHGAEPSNTFPGIHCGVLNW